MEGGSFNTSHTIWYGNGFERGASIECIFPNTCYTIRDNSILASSNKRVGGCFYNCITILTTIINTIFFFYNNRDKGAFNESIIFNIRYAIGDSDGGERGAIIES